MTKEKKKTKGKGKGKKEEEESDFDSTREYKATVQQQLEYMKQLTNSQLDSSTGLPKNLSNETPSKVVHFRNVTQDISQGDIMSLCAPFGNVENALIVRTKNQCLLMFTEMKSSMEFINYYISNYAQPTVRGRKMYVSFSRHQTITAENSRVSNILLVTFHCTPEPEEVGVPITTDVVYQIFNPYGNVQKVVIVKKQNLQALVQFETQAMCAQAYDYLNDQKVYVGTDPDVEIKLVVQYSHLTDLTIRFPQLAMHRSVFQAPSSADYTGVPTMPLPGALPSVPSALPPDPSVSGYPGYSVGTAPIPPMPPPMPSPYAMPGMPPTGGLAYPPPPGYGPPPGQWYGGYPPPPLTAPPLPSTSSSSSSSSSSSFSSSSTYDHSYTHTGHSLPAPPRHSEWSR